MTKPNIILLHAHNTGRFIEPYGHAVPTPHLLRMARSGALFRRAFSAAPSCSPSRAAFLTGQYPHCAGMLGLAHRGFGLSHPQRHIAHVLRGHGYETAQCGIEHVHAHEPGTGVGGMYDVVLTRDGSARAADVAPAVCDYTISPSCSTSAPSRRTHRTRSHSLSCMLRRTRIIARRRARSATHLLCDR